MDQMMVDVTHISDIAVGDEVILIGQYDDQCITMEQIAEAAGSFNYEFMVGISRRVPRYYVKDGKTVQTVHYLLDT
jgi:alanine racemase